MNILHIDSGILGEHSVSRRLTAAIVSQIKADHPEAQTTYRDLVVERVPHLTGAQIMAPADLAGVEPALAEDIRIGRLMLEEFLAADTVVVGAPMYNFSIPSQLKAWIDRLAVSGKTFRYTEAGPEGLAKGKKVIVVSTRGGHYSAGPAAAMDHQESYLRTVFGFFGITDVEFVRAEGLNLGADQKQSAIAEAEKTIAEGSVLRLAS
ncbi:FMN-dependent NADH-azoreductase [Sinorhizobium saheli]|uniref:FMN dependent NADH:quinone oxidoreductase n=1 Tax=Sinorhizobium saheli TaxID=36856 RepID=A0A178YN20_SINSA|nr:FMN-dependent NADH-azoreductase [Sinorhizobium saheli]MQW88289.1 FMN-dependent NADH-azoreductase [Sinorhizobium saheli]OAP48962.1 FMN-dependent NADH-azoreductase [Sinorhizobium saheli]